MSIPSLKRVRISTDLELRRWLAKGGGDGGPVMLVTKASGAPGACLGGAEVRAAIRKAGYHAGRSYTLNGGLLGHVVERG